MGTELQCPCSYPLHCAARLSNTGWAFQFHLCFQRSLPGCPASHLSIPSYILLTKFSFQRKESIISFPCSNTFKQFAARDRIKYKLLILVSMSSMVGSCSLHYSSPENFSCFDYTELTVISQADHVLFYLWAHANLSICQGSTKIGRAHV